MRCRPRAASRRFRLAIKEEEVPKVHVTEDSVLLSLNAGLGLHKWHKSRSPPSLEVSSLAGAPFAQIKITPPTSQHHDAPQQRTRPHRHHQSHARDAGSTHWPDLYRYNLLWFRKGRFPRSRREGSTRLLRLF